MIVRFGYVAMSMEVKNASPSKTMTAARFRQIADREAAVRKLERIAEENLHNTLRLLYHNRAHDIKVYRFSSRLIPLLGHEWLEGWNPLPRLAPSLQKIGEYVRKHDMRVSFHPDHFTVLSTPRRSVLEKSAADLGRHTAMLEHMGLDERAKCNIHIGGTYGNKARTMERFLKNFAGLKENIRRRITLENDDKTYTAAETLTACQHLGVPMVLDLHHHQVNHNGEDALELWPDILRTWRDSGEPPLPPKIHVSSPKSPQNPRGHADYVDLEPLLAFLRGIAPHTPELDVMIEAKMKDRALFRLMETLPEYEGVQKRNQASVVL